MERNRSDDDKGQPRANENRCFLLFLLEFHNGARCCFGVRERLHNLQLSGKPALVVVGSPMTLISIGRRRNRVIPLTNYWCYLFTIVISSSIFMMFDTHSFIPSLIHSSRGKNRNEVSVGPMEIWKSRGLRMESEHDLGELFLMLPTGVKDCASSPSPLSIAASVDDAVAVFSRRFSQSTYRKIGLLCRRRFRDVKLEFSKSRSGDTSSVSGRRCDVGDAEPCALDSSCLKELRSACPFVYPSIHPSVERSVHLSVCPHFPPSIDEFGLTAAALRYFFSLVSAFPKSFLCTNASGDLTQAAQVYERAKWRDLKKTTRRGICTATARKISLLRISSPQLIVHVFRRHVFPSQM